MVACPAIGRTFEIQIDNWLAFGLSGR